MKNKKAGQDVIASMFLTAAAAMIFTQVAGVIATIIDGVVTSRFLGTDAYSAISLLVPLTNIILLLASFISIGGQILCAQKIGTGERQEASAIFTFSNLFGLVVALLFVVACLLAPGILFRICGVSLKERPELYTYMLSYLRGYLPGIPAVIMVQVGSIHLPYLSAVLRLADEVDVASDRNPSFLYDNIVMLTQKDVEAFHSHKAIKNVTVETGKIQLEVKADNAEVLKDVRDIAGKIRETLCYCRDIAPQRSALRITQESVELTEGEENGRND